MTCCNEVFPCWLCKAEYPHEMGLFDPPTCDNGGTAKGQVASTNLTLLATISTQPKGA